MVAIRCNLWTCLRQFRESSAPIDLWIDALTIEQSDLAEKSQQVQMIGKIFQAASRVMIWLVEPALYTDKFLQQAALLPANGVVTPYKNVLRDHEFDQYEVCKFENRAELESAVMSIRTRSYWTRAWIPQEVILANAITVHCGGRSVGWDQFLSLSTLVSGRPSPAVTYTWGSSSHAPMLDHIAGQRAARNSYPRSYFEVFSAFHHSNCFDLHDKVYAFRELLEAASPDFASPIVVDYEQSLFHLYFCTIFSIVSKEKCSRVIHITDLLRQQLQLTADEIETAVRDRIDDLSTLFLTMRDITGKTSSDGRQELLWKCPEQNVYNFADAWAADFERLATGKRTLSLTLRHTV